MGKIPGHELTGEDPSVVRLDGTGAEDSTVGFGDDDGSVFRCMRHVAARKKGSKTDELDGRLWNIMDQGAEAGGADMSGMDGRSIGADDRDGSGKCDGLEKIGEVFGDGERRAGVELEGCNDRSIGGSCSWVQSCSCQREVRGFDVIVNRIEVLLGWRWDNWVSRWFGSDTGCEKDGLCFLERSLGSCDLGRSWIDSSCCFGFFGFSMLEGALEAVCIVTAAYLSHGGVEHLGACCAFGLSGVGR